MPAMECFAKTAWFPFAARVVSDVFMTFAWYRHLRSKESQPLWGAIVARWAIAFFEQLVMVPANRYGSARFSLYHLKLTQEAVTRVVFVLFAFLCFGTKSQWNQLATFLCILAAVSFTFLPGK
jgi:uncharacterized protein (DUF486 family)